MHPLADVAQQDLLPPTAPASRGAMGLHRVSQLAARVLHAWMDGWTWYARQGLSPAAVEPVFPFRRRARPVRALRARRWAGPRPPTRFALLYGRPARAGCP
ncbi:MAG TPA: hypothetical protein VGB15_11985 [Longimicrobium sp.]|jgi:hypothetical protein